RAALGAVLSGDGQDAVVSDRLITGEFAVDHAAAYVDRASRFGAVGAGALVGLVWSLVRWMRRSHDALYTTLGACWRRRSSPPPSSCDRRRSWLRSRTGDDQRRSTHQGPWEDAAVGPDERRVVAMHDRDHFDSAVTRTECSR